MCLAPVLWVVIVNGDIQSVKTEKAWETEGLGMSTRSETAAAAAAAVYERQIGSA
jgi:hypothetical protein